MGITKGKSNIQANASILQNPLFWLAALLLAFMLIRSQYIGIPFERDEGAYAFYGQQILEGGIPYLDFHAMKYPFIFYFYAGIEAIFGTTLEGVQTGFLFLTTANVALIFFVARYFFTDQVGLLAAAAYAILSFSTAINGFTCQSEHGLMFFMLLGALVITRWLRSGNNYLLPLAGILVALSFQIKQTAALLVLFLGLVIIAQNLWRSRPDVLKAVIHGALYTLGFIICLGAFALLLKWQGAWQSFIFWTVDWPQMYLGQRTLDEGINNLTSRVGDMMTGFWPLWMASLAGLVAAWASRLSLQKKVGLTTLLLLSFATVVPGLRFYGHYWIQLLPALVILLGVGLSEGGVLLKKRYASGKWLYRTIATAILISPILMSSQVFFDPDHTQILRDTYGMNPFPEMREIGTYLKPKVNDGETIAIFGSEPQLYFYTNTTAPSSYSYFSHLVKNIDESQQWQHDFLDSVKTKQPRYIVYLKHSVSWNSEKGASKPINEWAGSYLNQNYRPVGIVDLIPDNVQYVFGSQAASYQPRSSGHIFVLQRRY